MHTRLPALRRLLTSSTAALALGAVLLTSCSSDEDGGSSPATSSEAGSSSAGAGGESAAPEEEPYLPVPDGVTLTEPGSELEVGETATVAWEPRQKTVGVLDITVTGMEVTTFEKSFGGWKLTPEVRKTTPYFVRARIENVGDTKLGGVEVPLYIVDGNNTLVRYSRFASTFKPCDSGDLPKGFGPGAKTQVCLVYLAPDKGDLTAVSFRPTEEFDPITWTGPVRKVGAGQDKPKNNPKNKRG